MGAVGNELKRTEVKITSQSEYGGVNGSFAVATTEFFCRDPRPAHHMWKNSLTGSAAHALEGFVVAEGVVKQAHRG